MSAPTSNQKLLDFVERATALCQPDRVEWCDGSAEEYDRLCALLVEGGTVERLADDTRPPSVHPKRMRRSRGTSTGPRAGGDAKGEGEPLDERSRHATPDRCPQIGR